MNATEKNLLIRVARRLEEHAMTRQPIGNVKHDAEMRRRRDRELGDAKDLRDLAKRNDGIGGFATDMNSSRQIGPTAYAFCLLIDRGRMLTGMELAAVASVIEDAALARIDIMLDATPTAPAPKSAL